MPYCEICGERLPVKPTSAARYCVKCRRVVAAEKRAQDANRIRKQQPVSHPREAVCVWCGGTFHTTDRTRRRCDACRELERLQLRPHRPRVSKPKKPKETTTEAIIRINREARAAGMSYGVYVASMGGRR